jgi:hypothetical protein
MKFIKTEKQFEMLIKDLLSIRSGGSYFIRTMDEIFELSLSKNVDTNKIKKNILSWLSVEGRIL